MNFDAKLRKKLLGIHLTSKGIVVDHTIEVDDVPPEFLPTIKLLTLSVQDAEEMRGGGMDESGYNKITRTHIVGWSNLWDMATETEFVFVPGRDGACTEKQFKALPNFLKVEIIRQLSTYSMV